MEKGGKRYLVIAIGLAVLLAVLTAGCATTGGQGPSQESTQTNWHGWHTYEGLPSF
jgi:hypothetical protein